MYTVVLQVNESKAEAYSENSSSSFSRTNQFLELALFRPQIEYDASVASRQERRNTTIMLNRQDIFTVAWHFRAAIKR
ncbi:hypothetical protein D918_06724 [Trichuris suis]|nr:hypothetical protein D918_06724 [Trichuris suis]